jgi:hypothetical protein
VDPVPDPLISKNLVAPEMEPGTSGSVARNSDHYHRGGHRSEIKTLRICVSNWVAKRLLQLVSRSLVRHKLKERHRGNPNPMYHWVQLEVLV